jgi:hypothetical protein
MKATTLETCLRRETAETVKGLAEQEQRSVSSMLRILVEKKSSSYVTRPIS